MQKTKDLSTNIFKKFCKNNNKYNSINPEKSKITQKKNAINKNIGKRKKSKRSKSNKSKHSDITINKESSDRIKQKFIPHFPPKKYRNNEKIDNDSKSIDKIKPEFKRKDISVYNEKLNQFKSNQNFIIENPNKNDGIIILIINNIEKEKRQYYFNAEELNSLPYKYAKEIDIRNYFQYYWSLLKLKHLIIFTFFANDDYNIFLLKFNFFLISFSLYLAVNAMFFSDNSIHKQYKSRGKYNFIYQIPKILYSTIISTITNIFLKKLSLSQNDILKLKHSLDLEKAKNETIKMKKCLKIKFILFLIIGFILLLFFWYFLSCFCCVFANSQISLLKDTSISYTLSMLYPFALNLLPGIFRIPALRKNNRNILYMISRIISFI